MGGTGSGGSNRLSDDEKKRRGTLDSRHTEKARAAKAAEKVVIGPWLSEIPEPDLPLGEVGRKKYFELVRSLFDSGKLTLATKMLSEQAAVLQEQMHRRMTEGKSVPTNMSEKIQRVIAQLGIAENAPQIARSKETAGKFTFAGFSNRRIAKV